MTDVHPAVAPTMPLGSLALAPGAKLAERYEVLALLGEGGMGAVYRVLDHELGEEVALKLLRPELANAEGALDRFRREVKLARRVTHPNVARTYDLGSADGIRFLTMELVRGEPLSRSVGDGRRMPMPEALRVITEIARGLAAAHAVGVVHRDLKPDNVMVANDRVVITDFGIARVAEGAMGLEHATRTMGAAIGTPAYMAPEQVEGKEVDGRADIYALGIVLYQLLLGALPFAGETIYALVAARLSTDPPDPRDRDAAIPAPLADLILAAMARRRDQRPDAQTVLQRLDALRGDVRAAPEGRVGTVRPPPGSPTSAVTPTTPRTIAIAPFAASDANARAIAGDLAEAVSNALASLRWAKVLPAATVAAAVTGEVGARVDPRALGSSIKADLVVAGSLTMARERLRLRVQIVEVQSGAQVWGATFDGTTDDPFALEDRLAREVGDALRVRVGDSQRRGPSDPEVRALWEGGLRAYHLYTPASLKESMELLEKALGKAPGDPYVMSALGATLLRSWRTTFTRDRMIPRRAEELSLRALAIDPTIGDTYNSIAIVRLYQGDLRAAVRGFEEAIARSPRLVDAHSWLGRLLVESGHFEEGIRRLQQATEISSDAMQPLYEQAKIFTLIGDQENTEKTITRAIALGGVTRRSMLFHRLRAALWFRDHALAADVLAGIDEFESKESMFQGAFAPALRAILDGTDIREGAKGFFALCSGDTGTPYVDAVMNQMLCEVLLAANDSESLRQLEKTAEQRAFFDVFWLDRCPLLETLRDEPRFARARALAAARAAEMWGR